MEIMLPEARLSFDVLGTPERYQNKPDQTPRWGAVFLVPQGSAIAKSISKAIEQVATEKWGAKAPKILAGILADKKACCFIDGDTKEYDGYDGYEGMMALSAYRYEDKGRPIVMDNDLSPIYKADNSFYEGKAGRIYGGCYVRAKVDIWAQDNVNGKGIRCTLMVVQRLRAGDAFGGGKPPTAEGFEAIADGADDEDDMS